MIREKIKINHDDIIEALRYSYLANRYLILTNLHKDDDKVSTEMKLDWVDKYIQNSISYKIKSLEIMKDNNISFGRVVRYDYDLENELFDYCMREIDNDVKE